MKETIAGRKLARSVWMASIICSWNYLECFVLRAALKQYGISRKFQPQKVGTTCNSLCRELPSNNMGFPGIVPTSNGWNYLQCFVLRAALKQYGISDLKALIYNQQVN